MALAALALCGAMSLVAEKMPFAQGLGFDGIHFAMLVKDFDKLLDGSLQLGIASYNRFLPSLVCRLVLKGLGIALTDRNIVLFFQTYNVLLLAAGAWLWAKTAELEGLSARGRWLGFVALFCSHAVLKYNIFYATLTDVTAMTLGLAMLWSWRRGANLALLAATAAGALTWPTLLPQGLLLWVFPYRPQADGRTNGQAVDRPAPICSAVLTVALLVFLVRHFFARGEVPLEGSIWPLAGAAMEAAYVGAAAFWLFNDRLFFTPLALVKRLSLPRLVLAAAAVAALPVILFRLTGFRIDYWAHGIGYIYESVRLGMKYPGEFLISHPLYFGPWVLLLFLLFPQAARLARRGGPGLPLLCLMTVIQSLTPLSRQLIAGMPFFVFLAAGAADRDQRLGERFLPWFTVLSLVFSKAWMRFSPDASCPDKSFSFDWYVSSTGCWMPYGFYVIQGLIVLAVALGLWLVLRRRAALVREGA